MPPIFLLGVKVAFLVILYLFVVAIGVNALIGRLAVPRGQRYSRHTR